MDVLVAFRADASVQIGAGHVMRCLTLADELTRNGHQCIFICRELRGHLGNLIVSKGYRLNLLPDEIGNEPIVGACGSDNYALWLGVPWEVDALQTLGVLKCQKPDWLVVDHYGLNADWELTLAKSAGRIMAIDDLANREHRADLLLDQNLGRSADDYESLVPPHCIRLIGTRYAMLRPEFADFRKPSLQRRRNAELGRILISMGGMDIPNTTSDVLKALESSDLPSSTKLDVVMGSSAPKLREVHRLSERSRFETSFCTDVSNMAERMCLADLSIGAAGSTSWERCVLGLPSIAVSQALNQSEILEALCSAGAAEELDFPFEHSELVEAVNSFFQHPEKLATMAANASGICDGQGVARVIEWLDER